MALINGNALSVVLLIFFSRRLHCLFDVDRWQRDRHFDQVGVFDVCTQKKKRKKTKRLQLSRSSSCMRSPASVVGRRRQRCESQRKRRRSWLWKDIQRCYLHQNCEKFGLFVFFKLTFKLFICLLTTHSCQLYTLWTIKKVAVHLWS